MSGVGGGREQSGTLCGIDPTLRIPGRAATKSYFSLEGVLIRVLIVAYFVFKFHCSMNISVIQRFHGFPLNSLKLVPVINSNRYCLSHLQTNLTTATLFQWLWGYGEGLLLEYSTLYMTSYTLLYSSAMAEQQTQFAYHNIQLYKSESLGSGSYGGVCKAKCDGLLCAAKIMHPTLFDLRDPGTASYLRKFQEECHLLSLARHPNVVQYLATYYDPDNRLPVLLMELCDESLTSFLERSPGPLSYHVQLNICLDIALALVYLHSNGLIHRDLTGNNVLMIAGTRAKITDFGMFKLATGNPRMTALTLCPGNLLYMSPEALDEAKSYTAKLDIFSFGVIVIQILTRQFPNPTDRFRTVQASQNDEDEDDEEDEVRRLVPETERRQAHLQLIPDTHSLKQLALQCLKKKERSRPSALQLSERLSELKQAPQYTESMH